MKSEVEKFAGQYNLKVDRIKSYNNFRNSGILYYYQNPNLLHQVDLKKTIVSISISYQYALK